MESKLQEILPWDQLQRSPQHVLLMFAASRVFERALWGPATSLFPPRVSHAKLEIKVQGFACVGLTQFICHHDHTFAFPDCAFFLLWPILTEQERHSWKCGDGCSKTGKARVWVPDCFCTSLCTGGQPSKSWATDKAQCAENTAVQSNVYKVHWQSDATQARIYIQDFYMNWSRGILEL